MKERHKPLRCIERNPTSQHILFSGEYINISYLAQSIGLSHSFVSRVFSGQRQPSLINAKKMAKALGMSVSSFIRGLEIHTSRENFYGGKLAKQAPNHEMPSI